MNDPGREAIFHSSNQIPISEKVKRNANGIDIAKN
jgi:hypothetical protein